MTSRPLSQADADAHFQRVEAVVLKRQYDLRVDPWLRRSWMRCVGDHALDPSKPSTPRMLEPQELRRRIADMGACYSLAKAEIARLCESLEFAAGISLTDADGVILLYAGTASFAGIARYSGFREGAVWSEAEQGTNGMGTCLLTRAPIVVEGGAHFLVQNTGLTCYAAPILSGSGNLLGAINISSLDALPRGPMLSLLDMAVQSIESRLLSSSPKHFVLSFHRRQEYVGTVAEGIVAFSEDGRIAGVNRNGMRLLGASSHDGIYARFIQELLDIDAIHLAEMHRLHAGEVFPLFWPGAARRGFGKLRLPSPMAWQCRMETGAGAENALIQAESSALAGVLQRCQWNISRAAKELGIGRKTLYRKMHKHRLMKPSQP